MPTQTFFNLAKDKQDRIMDAVLDELALNAYEHFNISNVIRNTRIARGSFYQYFKDKDDIYNYFFAYITEKKMAYYGSLFSLDENIPFQKRLKLIYEKGLAFACDHPKLLRVSEKMVSSNYFLSHPSYQKGLAYAENLFEQFIIKDIKLKRLRDDVCPKTASKVILNSLNHFTTRDLIDKKTPHQQMIKHIDLMIDFFMKGLEK